MPAPRPRDSFRGSGDAGSPGGWWSARRRRRLRGLWPAQDESGAQPVSVEEWRDESGRLHREDGPARVTGDSEEWRRHGELHRVGGPAMVRPHALIWAVEGERHRLDGPAVLHADGTREWWVEGQRIHGLDADRLDALHDAGDCSDEIVALLDAFRSGRS